MIWTAISYNWSSSTTQVSIILAGYDKSAAIMKFKEKFPGENLLALISGDHSDKTSTYPLLLPDFNNNTGENSE